MEKNEKKRGYKVAVCDDEQIYTDSLVAELKKSEYEFDISAFSSGEQLLEAKEAFQIIFLDAGKRISGVDYLFDFPYGQFYGGVSGEVVPVFVKAVAAGQITGSVVCGGERTGGRKGSIGTP